ncbi:MAG: hypothetical protein M3Z04_04275 [Chloroflexota bacterium]|nr:hypothetical protein [Chloroflexota bacterium]
MQPKPGALEELDQEPTVAAHRWSGPLRGRLGGALTLLALAGGWDWAQTSSQATAYHQGVAAVAARHWEAAAGAFAAAGGYADAAARGCVPFLPAVLHDRLHRPDARRFDPRRIIRQTRRTEV